MFKIDMFIIVVSGRFNGELLICMTDDSRTVWNANFIHVCMRHCTTCKGPDNRHGEDAMFDVLL